MSCLGNRCPLNFGQSAAVIFVLSTGRQTSFHFEIFLVSLLSAVKFKSQDWQVICAVREIEAKQ